MMQRLNNIVEVHIIFDLRVYKHKKYIDQFDRCKKID